MSEHARGPQSYFPSIEAKYGQPVEHWFSVLDSHRELTHMQMVSVLKSDHGLGHGHANALVAHYRSQHAL